LNLSEIAQVMSLSVRTLARAKAELDGYGLVKFRTISNGEGKGHKLHACLPHKLAGKRGELLHATKAGKERISRTKVGGEVIHRPTLKPRPHDTPYTIGSYKEHQYKKTPTVRQGLERKATSKQVKLAHWLKRELWKRHFWDNCRVQKSDSHAFGYALRAIQAGFDISEIHRAFESALKVMHGVATDVVLNTGQPTHTLFCLSSTVSLAQRTLQKWRVGVASHTRSSSPSPTRSRTHTHRKKGDAHRTRPTIPASYDRTNAPVPTQSARFADIMAALA
jgi:hypothetical protein